MFDKKGTKKPRKLLCTSKQLIVAVLLLALLAVLTLYTFTFRSSLLQRKKQERYFYSNRLKFLQNQNLVKANTTNGQKDDDQSITQYESQEVNSTTLIINSSNQQSKQGADESTKEEKHKLNFGDQKFLAQVQTNQLNQTLNANISQQQQCHNSQQSNLADCILNIGNNGSITNIAYENMPNIKSQPLVANFDKLEFNAMESLKTENTVSQTQTFNVDNNLSDDSSKQQIQEIEKQQSKQLPTIAYVLMAGKGDIQLVMRLLRRIYDPSNIYAIHFDKKAPDDEFQQLQQLIQQREEFRDIVHTIPRYIVTYQCISMVDVEITAIAYLMEISSSWSYLINLSPAHYPLYPQNYIKQALQVLPVNASFISHKRAKCMQVRGEYMFLDRGLAGEHVEGTINTGVKRPILQGYDYYKGSQWHAVSRSFAEYVVKSPDGLARRLLLYLAGYFIPDESYFQTVACNSDYFKSLTVEFDFHYVDWYHGQNRQKGKEWSPSVITNHTLWQAYKSGAMFARKFIADDTDLGLRSIAAMNIVDQLFINKTFFVGKENISLDFLYNNAIKIMQERINLSLELNGCVQREEPC